VMMKLAKGRTGRQHTEGRVDLKGGWGRAQVMMKLAKGRTGRQRAEGRVDLKGGGRGYCKCRRRAGMKLV